MVRNNWTRWQEDTQAQSDHRALRLFELLFWEYFKAVRQKEKKTTKNLSYLVLM